MIPHVLKMTYFPSRGCAKQTKIENFINFELQALNYVLHMLLQQSHFEFFKLNHMILFYEPRKRMKIFHGIFDSNKNGSAGFLEH